MGDSHDHHQVAQPVSGPAAEPCHLPIAEARADRDWRPKAKELGFELHRAERSSQHIH
jgi:hypothetical protein